MPLSLRIIKECASYNLDWKNLHIADLFSIIYSIRIDNANNYLDVQRKQTLSQKGIQSVSIATDEDFDNL